jgi:serine/threonine-protein kinase
MPQWPTAVRSSTNLSTDEAHRAFSAAAADVLVYARASPDAGETQLTWLDRAGRELERVGERGIWSNVVLSPDGTRAVLHRVDADPGGRALWMLDVASKRLSRFTTENGRTGRALWSPDGARILYSFSQPEGRSRLYERRADGASPPRVVVERPTIDVYPDAWSHGGRVVLYATRNSAEGAGAVDLWTRDLSAGTDAPFMQTRFTENEADVSRDDRWVAYDSDESGRREVYVAPFAGGARWQVSNGGGRAPRWRRDTRELFYLDPDGALQAVPVTVAGAALEFGAPVRLFDLNLAPGIPRYDISHDGARVLAAVPVVVPGTTTLLGLIVNGLHSR